MKLNIGGILALLTTIAGILSSPAILNAVSAKQATVIIAVGAILQAVTKAIHDGEKKAP